MTYEKNGDISLALSKYKKALEINPEYNMASQKLVQLEKNKLPNTPFIAVSKKAELL